MKRRWYHDNLGMVRDGLVFGGIALVVVVLIVGFGIADYAVESRNCAYAQRRTHHRTHYDLWADCYIEVAGRWIPFDRYQTFKQER